MESKQDFRIPPPDGNNTFKEVEQTNSDEFTKDGSLDWKGKSALKPRTGGWKCGTILLVNQGLVTLAFAGVEVNMVLFSKSVLGQTNAEAANTLSRWMGTTYLFSLMGAFLSDSYLGRYLTCVIFQVICIVGLVALSISSYVFLLKPHGCGKIGFSCETPRPIGVVMFYLSVYLIALGNGASEPALATFGADQFDEEDPVEKQSKTSYYSYFYISLNLGCLIAETVLVYIENNGDWVLGYSICSCSAIVASLFLLSGSMRYRHFKISGNPFSRFCKVLVASFKKINLQVPQNGEGLYEVHEREGAVDGARKLVHTDGFRFLDRAAIVSPADTSVEADRGRTQNPWVLCTVTQVEEVKCILRLIPIWCCTILSSMVFIEMLSLFVEQGAAMNREIFKFQVPPASMTAFDIVTTSAFILLYDRVVVPLFIRTTKREPKPPSELQRIGIGLAIAVVALIIAGIVEQQRLKYAAGDKDKETSSLSIFWQTPQYVLVGVSEAIVYVAQMEFFASQTPDALKSLGVGLSMSSSAIGSYVCCLILSVVMKITSKHGKPGWVPRNLNHGHLDRFFFLSAALMAANLGLYIVCAKRYRCISFEKRDNGQTKQKLNLSC